MFKFKKYFSLILSFFVFTASASEKPFIPRASDLFRESKKAPSAKKMGTAVIITGVSGVGKSSAIKELRRLLGATWIPLAVDSEEMDALVEEADEADLPEETSLVLENHILLQQIETLTTNGMNVLCDTVLVSQEALTEFQRRIARIGCPVHLILLDCRNIEILFDNLRQRNHSRNPQETRRGYDVADQFRDLHRPRSSTPPGASAPSASASPAPAPRSFHPITNSPQQSPPEASSLLRPSGSFSRPDSPSISMEQVRAISGSPLLSEREQGLVLETYTRAFNLEREAIVELTHCIEFSKVIYVDGKTPRTIAQEIRDYINQVMSQPEDEEDDDEEDEDGDFGNWSDDEEDDAAAPSGMQQKKDDKE